MDVPSSERILYQARLKAERDARWRINNAREAGYQAGRRMVLQEIVTFLQHAVYLPESSKDELSNLSIDELEQLLDSLKARCCQLNSK